MSSLITNSEKSVTVWTCVACDCVCVCVLRVPTDRVHVDATSEWTWVLVGLDEARRQRFRYEVKLDELSDAGEHLMIFLSTSVQTQHNRRDVAEYRGTHQSYTPRHRQYLSVTIVARSSLRPHTRHNLQQIACKHLHLYRSSQQRPAVTTQQIQKSNEQRQADILMCDQKKTYFNDLLGRKSCKTATVMILVSNL